MTNHQPAHKRDCADCLFTAEEYWADARWISEAGAAQGNPMVAQDLLLADLWEQINRAHDEGSR